MRNQLGMFVFATVLTWPVLVSSQTSRDGQSPYIGRWQGKAKTESETTAVSLEINQSGKSFGAAITLLNIGVMNWPASKVVDKQGTLELSFPTDSSQQRFVLKKPVKGRLEGTWHDSRYGENAVVSLNRSANASSLRSNPLLIVGPAGRLSTEYVLPKGDGPFPGVVFVHGSGPQSKAASRFSAHALAGLGIASIAYDKRGVGGSEGNWQRATFEELAADAIAVAKQFQSINKVSRVGFLGQSQGGWIATLAASQWQTAAFVVSIAGPAVSPSREAHWEFVRAVRRFGGSEKDEVETREIMDQFHYGIRTGKWNPFQELRAKSSQRSWFLASGLSRLKIPDESEWLEGYRSNMNYDPLPALKNLNAPLLSLLSPDDESVDAMETAAILRTLKETGIDLELRLFPGFDHGMHQNAEERTIRWPSLPPNYFQIQAAFVSRATAR